MPRGPVTRPAAPKPPLWTATWEAWRWGFSVSVVGPGQGTGRQSAQIYAGQAFHAPAPLAPGPAAGGTIAALRDSVHPRPREGRRHRHCGVPSALPLAALALWALPISPAAAPKLRCEVDQGGKTQTIEVAPVSDPYGVQGTDINGRFRFKAVLVGDADHIDYVALYTRYLSDGRPVLLHEAKYQAP